jgi:hypothetical protein
MCPAVQQRAPLFCVDISRREDFQRKAEKGLKTNLAFLTKRKVNQPNYVKLAK